MLNLTDLALYAVTIAATIFGDSSTPVPSEANFQHWTEYILPSAEELRHEEIPWITTFGAGLLAAGEQAKPLLFWGMNGHPLGCT